METCKVWDLVQFDPASLKKIPLFESARLFCDLYCLRPEQEQKIHRHPESDKVYFVLEGEGTFHVEGEERVLGAGEMVWAKAGQAHGVANHSSGSLVCLVFMAPHPHPSPGG